jgi:hypothetical protein
VNPVSPAAGGGAPVFRVWKGRCAICTGHGWGGGGSMDDEAWAWVWKSVVDVVEALDALALGRKGKEGGWRRVG